MSRMNYTNFRRWLDDLRTTDAPQGRAVLHGPWGFCCLGRACEVALPDLPTLEVSIDADGDYTYDGDSVALPPSVRSWLGLTDHPEFHNKCVTMNDVQGLSFPEIADRLEEAYPIPFAFLTEPYRTRMLALYDALRSGDYEQGRSSLNFDNRLCCLGVACEIAHEDIPLARGFWYDGARAVAYDECSDVLPARAQRYYGFKDGIGRYRTGSLAGDNDRHRKTFTEIAEIMATNESLFTDEALGVAMDVHIAKLSKLTSAQFEWVFALSNGFYSQGTGKLCRVENGQKRYCCLGVACDLAKEAGLPLSVEVCGRTVRFDGEINYVPPAVKARLGLRSSVVSSLAIQNDLFTPFEEIAQTIIDNSEELFV